MIPSLWNTHVAHLPHYAQVTTVGGAFSPTAERLRKLLCAVSVPHEATLEGVQAVDNALSTLEALFSGSLPWPALPPVGTAWEGVGGWKYRMNHVTISVVSEPTHKFNGMLLHPGAQNYTAVLREYARLRQEKAKETPEPPVEPSAEAS
jgi:hypothetical protein